MPRSISLGNGNLLVTLDANAALRDVYFPYVGMEDHTTFGHHHRLGIYEEETGNFSWLSDNHWKSSAKYLKETLVSKTTLKSEDRQIKITFKDFVHPLQNALCRKITIKNLANHNRHFRIFFSFDFHLYGVKGNDTALYYSKENCLVFYKYNRYFLLNGKTDTSGINQYTTGKSEYRGLEGTWRDAEDGKLSSHPIEQGSVDATFGLHLRVAANSKNDLSTWIAAGQNLKEVEAINLNIKSKGVNELMNYTKRYWKNWVNKDEMDFTGFSKPMKQLYKRSLLVIRTQIDNRGAIIAANDTDIMKFNKDSYSYMWPRDASLIAQSLDNAGYPEITRRYFEFCKKIQTEKGYLMHKYNPDGSLGSSWHAWNWGGDLEFPIQEDETALPIIAIRNHYRQIKDIEFIQEIFDKFVRKAAKFLSSFIDPNSNLPKPSYDPWEEQKGVFTYTCSTVYGGLVAAAELSEIVGHKELSQEFLQRAEKIKEAILKHLYCEKEQTFVKKITRNEKGEWIKDYTADSSISAIFLFGVLPAKDKRVASTMKKIREKLTVQTEIGGIARYQNDYYHAVGERTKEIPGNPWVITTLWYAQWLLLIAKSKNSEEFTEAEELINWVIKRSSKSGILPEQVNPNTGEPLSVAPLTWSHSTYVDTVLLYRKKLSDFGIYGESCNPDIGMSH